MATRSSSDTATRSGTCSRCLESRRRPAFLMTITPKFLLFWLAMHRSCCGCIVRFDKETFFLLIGPDSGGKSGLNIERRQSNLPFYSLALVFLGSGRAFVFEWTMRKRRSRRRFFQKSWPVHFEGVPASARA